MCGHFKGIWDKIRNNKLNTFIIVLLLTLLVLSHILDFRYIVESRSSLVLFKRNVLYIINVISRSVPLLAFLLLVYIWRKIATKLVIRVEKLDVGGVSIIFERPEELFKQQIKNFLNTKRSLFSFEPERDNIYDCINSCYKIYEFIRENMSVYDTKSSQQSDFYSTANTMIHTLNDFLTSHQSDYRRWHENMLENANNQDGFKSITELQREYPGYDVLISDFANLNCEFRGHAKKFEVDVDKWQVNSK